MKKLAVGQDGSVRLDNSGRLITRRIFVMQLAAAGLAAESLFAGCASQPNSSTIASEQFAQAPNDYASSDFSDGESKSITNSESVNDLQNQHVARIVFISDTHIDWQFEPSIGHAQAAFTAMTQFEPAPNAIIINGDITNHGLSEEYDLTETLASESGLQFPDDFICVMGNHEQRGYDEEISPESFATQRELFMQRCKLERLYYDTDVNGIHIVVMGPDADPQSCGTIRLSEEQLSWLEETLAVDTQNGHPTFILLHQPINNTVIHTYEGEYAHDSLESSDALQSIVSGYPQVIMVTAHTHSPADFFRPDDDSPLYVADSAIAYLRHDPYADWSDDGVNYSCGILADVFGDRIEFLAWDFVQNEEDGVGGFTLEMA